MFDLNVGVEAASPVVVDDLVGWTHGRLMCTKNYLGADGAGSGDDGNDDDETTVI